MHGFPSNERQAAINRNLGELLVLNAVRPAPQNLAGRELHEVVHDRFRKQDHVALSHQLLPRADASNVLGEALVRDSEAMGVIVLEEHSAAQTGVDTPEMGGMNRQPALVRLPGCPDHTQAQPAHSCSCPRREAF